MIEHFKKVCQALLEKHYGIDLIDTHLWDDQVVSQCLMQGFRPYEVIAEHAEEADLDRIDKLFYGVPSKNPITQNDEDLIISTLFDGVAVV